MAFQDLTFVCCPSVGYISLTNVERLGYIDKIDTNFQDHASTWVNVYPLLTLKCYGILT